MNKIVSESLNELYKFEKKSNPLTSLNIGKKTLIEKWLKEMNIKEYNLNNDLTINVYTNVYFFGKNLVKFPDYIQFNRITGLFNCRDNNLSSLKGCPLYVGYYFDCAGNKLISLDGCPKIVESWFECRDNEVKFTEEDVKERCDVGSQIMC